MIVHVPRPNRVSLSPYGTGPSRTVGVAGTDGEALCLPKLKSTHRRAWVVGTWHVGASGDALSGVAVLS